MSNSKFIDEIAFFVRKYAGSYGIRVHSAIIAQAILESASGTSELSTVNNFFGLKWRANRCPTSNGYYIKIGSEQNPDGSYSSAAMKWFSFPDMDAGVKGYFDFINTPNYSNLKGVTDPETYLKNIKADKYATSINYVSNLMNVIKKYDLKKYDDPEEINMAKVFLSAGHGGSDPGAVSYGLKEKEINLQTLLACKEVLERHNVNVVCSRTTDENDPVSDEVKEANASGADIAVSFHVNAGGGDGFEAFYYSTSAKGKELARIAEKHIKAIGQNSRGLKTGNHLYFVRKTTMPAVLFESFFVDNDSDNNIGDTTAEQKEFGVAYAKAILEYLGIAYKSNAGSIPEAKPEAKPEADPGAGTIFRVQVGAFKSEENARALKEKLIADGYSAIIVK